jgi:hypothetical protein
MTKKISKVIIYYDDDTYEEVKTGVSDSQDKQNKETVSPSPVMPDLRPDYYKIRDWSTPTFVPDPPQPPWVVTCDTGNQTLEYKITEPGNYKFTSTGNFSVDDKYTITNTGNGNVDLSK